MSRALTAVLLTPAITAMLYLFLLSLGPRETGWMLAILVLVVTYMFALVPTAITMLVLKKLGWVSAWQFTVAGLVLAVFCNTLFVLYAHRHTWASFDAFLGEFLETHQLLYVGPVVGLLAWLISEARLRRVQQ